MARGAAFQPEHQFIVEITNVEISHAGAMLRAMIALLSFWLLGVKRGRAVRPLASHIHAACGTIFSSAAPIVDSPTAPNPSCSDRGRPARFIAKDGLPQ